MGCISISEIGENCTDKESESYIFWKENGKTYLTKRDNCFNYPVIEINKHDFWDLYFKNKDVIASEKIKWPEYIIIDNIGGTQICAKY